MAEEKPATENVTEEELALEELLAAENVDEGHTPNDDAASVAVDEGATDAEMAALEELMATESAPTKAEPPTAEPPGQNHAETGAMTKEAPSETKGETDEELAALDALVAAQEQTSPTQEPPDDAKEQTADDGIITLKEVVALGGTGTAPDVATKKETPADDALHGDSARPESPAPESPDEGMDIAGLSAEERNDLDKLIKGLREEKPSVGASQADLAALQKQVRAMKKRVIELTRVVTECDKRMRSFSEIMRLFFKKSEVMNKRIDAIADSTKGKPGS
ncbi:MAG: hypothetical protein JRI36_06855 [Deltaproteobacteria bacterium]|nr:hypothetical protein [Deltaproteobacteria bacterium]